MSFLPASPDPFDEILGLIAAASQPGLRGFTRPNLFRMKQFYEAYQEDEKVSPLVRQLPCPPGSEGNEIVSPLAAQFDGAAISSGDDHVVALLRQLPWTHHLIIMGQCKRPEEREFYLQSAPEGGDA